MGEGEEKKFGKTNKSMDFPAKVGQKFARGRRRWKLIITLFHYIGVRCFMVDGPKGGDKMLLRAFRNFY